MHNGDRPGILAAADCARAEPPVVDKSKHGFTLVELLVVLSIIALLISLLLPALKKAREAARVAVCASNSRQIGLGLTVYAQDFDRYPAFNVNGKALTAYWAIMGDPDGEIPAFWRSISDPLAKAQILNPYTNNPKVHQCPSDTGPYPVYCGGSPCDSYYKFYGTSYAYVTGAWVQGPILFQNTPISLQNHIQGLWYRHIDTIYKPSRQAMVAERAWAFAAFQQHPPAFGGESLWVSHEPHAIMNMTFVDGHVNFQRIHDSPDHYVNEDYEFLTPGAPPPTYP